MILKEIQYLENDIELVSYNDVYPPKIEMDFYRILRKEKYTFGDLHNILPPGLELTKGNRNRMNAPIARLVGYQSKLAEDMFFLDNSKNLFYEEKVEEVNVLEEERKKVREEIRMEKKKKLAAKPTKSLKETLKGEQDRLRALIQEEENKK